MNILTYYCRTCSKYTNHKIVSSEYSLPNHNFSTIQCITCESEPFNVQYNKEQETPLPDSQRVALGNTAEQITYDNYFFYPDNY